MASTEQHISNGHESDAAEPPSWIVGKDSSVRPVLSVVMPTMNEEEGVEECIERVKTAVEELEIPTEILISDSSSDQTPEIARELGAIVVEPDEMGYGYAYRYAFKRARGDFIVMGDADTTYDFEQIPRLLEHLKDTNADMVMGSRLEGEIKSGAMPTLHQYLGNPLLTKFLNAFYGAGVSDAHSGFRIMRREAIEEMELETTGMEFASEMIMKAGAKGLKIEEVPIVYHEREGEETLDSFRDGWRHVRFMLLNAPGYIFSVPGVLLSVFGVLVMATAISGVSLGRVSLGVNSLIAGSLFTLLGVQVGSFGVFSTIASDPIQRPNDVITERITGDLTLERGATAGFLVFAAGTAYAAFLLVDWVTTGFGNVPFTESSILAFTAIVLGAQVVFSSFFMSALAENC
jgi:glycosyltransferase involved in cell wall biosynthesis